MSYYDDKPKNKNDDYIDRFSDIYPEKSKNERYEHDNDRGGCLTAFLVVQAIYNVIVLIGACSLLNAPASRYGSGDEQAMLGILIMGVMVVRLALIAGIWNWNKWGYYGLLGLYGLGIVGSLCSGNFLTIVLLAIEAGIFYYLVQDKMDNFD